jgi:SOS regulatory protein LexA
MNEKYSQKISQFFKKNRRMPSYREIMTLAGFKSKNAAYYLVNKLIKQGLLQRDKTGRLIPLASLFAVPILGTVEAGFPTPAEEETADLMSLDEYLIENKEATFILKVSGESMIDAGIMPGDMVLVERGRDPRDGDIVIAEVDNAWTMKYFRKKGNKIILEPANKKFQPIIPKSDLRVAAVVRSVIRKY